MKEDLLKAAKWAPAFWAGVLLFVQIISMPYSVDEMPDACPEDSQNCARMTLDINASDDELHEAMAAWEDTRIWTSSFEPGHIVDRTMFMQFSDDLLYENQCGTVNFHSESRLGVSDLGVNQERLDDLNSFLSEWEFSGEGCQ